MRDVRQCWLFSPYPTTKRLLRAKFDELRPARNRIAHTRAIHSDDLRRIKQIMRDLDGGFWKFCTSYNDLHPFIADLQDDVVFQHFVGQMGGGYAQVAPGRWAQVANRFGMRMDMDLTFGIRPFCQGPRASQSSRGKGVFYRATFSVVHINRSFCTADILAATETVHKSLLYFHIDAHHTTTTVTIPSAVRIAAIRAFWNSSTMCVRTQLVRLS